VAALADMGIRTRVGPELYQSGWSERSPRLVAHDLATATRAVLEPEDRG
jgi:hypothetical protein